jgi:hypothetical protein
VQKGTHFKVGHGVAIVDVDGNKVASVTAVSLQMILTEFKWPKRAVKLWFVSVFGRCRKGKVPSRAGSYHFQFTVSVSDLTHFRYTETAGPISKLAARFCDQLQRIQIFDQVVNL